VRYYRTGRAPNIPWRGYAPSLPWWELVGLSRFLSLGKQGRDDAGGQGIVPGLPSCLGVGWQVTVSARTG
jgi:hypothetical protein